MKQIATDRPTCTPTNRSRRVGITLVETLVCVVIVAMLVALIIPAIQSSRESARRMQCASNLREIGIGLEHFESANGAFPPVNFQFSLLPYLGYKRIHDLIPAENLKSYGRLPTWELLGDQTVPLYVCPSDSGNTSALGSNYFPNYGSDFAGRSQNGLFQREKPVRARDVIDGLSNTAAIAEGLVSISNPPPRLRTIWGLIPRSTDIDLLPARCERIPLNPASLGYPSVAGRGVPWYGAIIPACVYNHLLPPNRPSCMNEFVAAFAVLTSSSTHTGGTNLLYADGHVRFESELIDHEVWREIGSRGSDVLE